jgi:hypothetical protein
MDDAYEERGNRIQSLEAACLATLLFFDAGPWDQEKRLRWYNLTQQGEATTKGLCDFIRERMNG